MTENSSYPSRSAAVQDEKNDEMDWDMRPGGVLVQKREDDDGSDVSSSGPMITVNVTHGYGPAKHKIFLPAQSTFGDMKKHLAQKTGLQPEDQRLLFRGKEKDDDEHLHTAGVKEMSKVLLLEDHASKERKLEGIKPSNGEAKALEAIAGIRSEVDKLSERVAALEVAVNGGTDVADKEFVVPTELLMRQLLKLDSIDAEGEAKLQRKAEVRRVQNFVDTLDSLMARNSNPFIDNHNAVSVTTEWETFDSGVGSLTPPPPAPSSTRVTQNWEQFD